MAERIVNYKDVTLGYAKEELKKAGYTPDEGGKTASKKTKQTWSYDGKEYSTEAEATQAAQQAIVDKNFAAASPEAKRGMIDEYSGVKGLGDAQQQIGDDRLDRDHTHHREQQHVPVPGDQSQVQAHAHGNQEHT